MKDLVIPLDDPALMAPAVNAQHVFRLQLITGPDAPVAFNAF